MRKLVFGLLLSIAAASVVVFAWKNRRTAPLEVTAIQPDLPIPEPAWGEYGKIAQQHVAELRATLERVRESPQTAPPRLAQAYGELGEVFLAYDIPAGAIACFRNAARLDGAQFRWPYLEAMAHFTGTDTQSGADAMREALDRMRRDPSVEKVHILAALCFLGESALRLNNAVEARGYFDEALRLNPNSVFASFKRGQLAVMDEKIEEGLRDFEHALSLYSGAKPAAICLAVATEYQKLGKSREAVKYRQMASVGRTDVAMGYPNPLLAQVRFLNRSAASLAHTVEAELARGNYQEALAKATEGLSFSPESINLRLLRAETLVQIEKWDEAIVELEEIRRRDAARQTGRALLCEVYARIPAMRQRAVDEAVAWHAEQPSEFRPQMTLGIVYFRLARFDEARENFAAAARLAPQEIAPGRYEILALCALGDFPAAVGRYELLQARFPEDTSLRHHYARFLATCPDESIRDPERSLKVVKELLADRPSVVLLETLACALAGCGRMSEARNVHAKTLREYGQSGQPSLRRRLRLVMKSLEANLPWREQWPFEEANEAKETDSQ